jgi:hypothetical protein
MTSTRPRTVAVVTVVGACACNPVAPEHNIAAQIRIPLWLIVDNSPLMAHVSFLPCILTMPFPSIGSKKNTHHQIEVTGTVSAVGNGIRGQMPKLSGK